MARVSGVHLFYVKDTERQQWVCRLCNSELKIQSASSTSNILNHLQGVHKIADVSQAAESLTEAARMSAPLQASSSGKQSTIGAMFLSDEGKAKLRRAVLAWLVADELPFALVSSEYFKNILEVLRPGSSRNLPSAQTLYKIDLPALYNDVCGHVIADLEQHKGPVAWMTDGWTASHSADSYGMISAAYCDGSTLRRVCLSAEYLPGRHDAASLKAQLTSVLQKFKVSERAWIGVTDTAAVMRALCLNEMRHCWMPCIAHTLNLVIQDAVEGLKLVDESLALLTDVARFFRQSSTATTFLDKAIQRTSDALAVRLRECDPARSANKQIPRKLKLRAPTRWNSVVDMLRRFYVLAPAVVVALAEHEVWMLHRYYIDSC
jgi:hypothetical protein